MPKRLLAKRLFRPKTKDSQDADGSRHEQERPGQDQVKVNGIFTNNLDTTKLGKRTLADIDERGFESPK